MCSIGRKSNKFAVEVLIDKSLFSFIPIELNEIVIKIKFSNQDRGTSHIHAVENSNSDLVNNHTTVRELEEFEFQLVEEAVDLIFKTVKM